MQLNNMRENIPHYGPLVEWQRYRTFTAEALGSIPAGIIWLPGQMAKMPPSHGGDTGFDSRGSCCGRRTTVVRQIVALLTGVRHPSVTPWMGMPSWSRAADCKSVTAETPQVRILPHPLMLAWPNGLRHCSANAAYHTVL